MNQIESDQIIRTNHRIDKKIIESNHQIKSSEQIIESDWITIFLQIHPDEERYALDASSEEGEVRQADDLLDSYEEDTGTEESDEEEGDQTDRWFDDLINLINDLMIWLFF